MPLFKATRAVLKTKLFLGFSFPASKKLFRIRGHQLYSLKAMLYVLITTRRLLQSAQDIIVMNSTLEIITSPYMEKSGVFRIEIFSVISVYRT